jgi:lipopolysaccharide transport system ATP-binding protein
MSSDAIHGIPLYSGQEEKRGTGNNLTHDGSELQEHKANDFAIRISSLSKCYQIYKKPQDRLKQTLYPSFRAILRMAPKDYHRKFWALKNVSFKVKRGESVGIIGPNGSGKSTLLQIICGTLMLTSGTVRTNGRIAALLELGSGFNPEFTGRENIHLNASINGFSKKEIQARYDQIVDFADIGEFIDQPVKTFSSGMLMRLAFASHTILEPQILIVDEALAVGDMSFQIKCFSRMKKLQQNGTTILFVSHNLSTVLSFCDRAVYLRKGEQVAFGQVEVVAKRYQQDCLAEKMVAKPSLKSENNKLLQPVSTTYPSLEEAERFASLAREHRNRFLAVAAQGKRDGSQRVTIESFVFVGGDGAPLEALSPTEEINGCFLLKFNNHFEGAIHLGIRIFDKCGSPLMVVRDSHFEQTISGVPGKCWLGKMRFALPLMAGHYYCTIGVLLYPSFEKYSHGRHDFGQAEISDSIEYGAHIQVLSFAWHPIPVPVLNESKLSLVSLETHP